MKTNIEEDIYRAEILAEYGLSHSLTAQDIQAIENILADRAEWKNKYDALVEKIKKKKRYFEECDELIANSNENYSDGTVIKRFIDILQELIPEEE